MWDWCDFDQTGWPWGPVPKTAIQEEREEGAPIAIVCAGTGNLGRWGRLEQLHIVWLTVLPCWFTRHAMQKFHTDLQCAPNPLYCMHVYAC